MVNFKFKNLILGVVIPLVAIAAIGAAFYFYKQLNMLKQDPQILAQQEVEALVLKVGKLMVLPSDELPTIATVADPETLKDQPFFARAEIGDKVLIYTTAKKAILYSVTLEKILDIAPLNIGTQEEAKLPPPVPQTNTSNTGTN